VWISGCNLSVVLAECLSNVRKTDNAPSEKVDVRRKAASIALVGADGTLSRHSAKGGSCDNRLQFGCLATLACRRMLG
jgi:hypothetical protein